MPDTPPPDPTKPMPPGNLVAVRAHMAQAAKLLDYYRNECLSLQTQIEAARDEAGRREAAHARQLQELQAAIDDRDRAHSEHLVRHEADKARLHRSVRKAGKASLERQAAAHVAQQDGGGELVIAPSAPRPPFALPAGATIITETPK